MDLLSVGIGVVVGFLLGAAASALVLIRITEDEPAAHARPPL